jgi:hypothetical protein
MPAIGPGMGNSAFSPFAPFTYSPIHRSFALFRLYCRFFCRFFCRFWLPLLVAASGCRFAEPNDLML